MSIAKLLRVNILHSYPSLIEGNATWSYNYFLNKERKILLLMQDGGNEHLQRQPQIPRIKQSQETKQEHDTCKTKPVLQMRRKKK